MGRLAMIVRALTAIGLFAAAVTFSAPTASADSITVTNGAPVANDDNYSVQAGTTLTVAAPGVLANDTDPEGDPITVGGVFAGPDNGSYTLDPDGTLTYTSDAGFNGTDWVTYYIVDNHGNFSSSTANAFITVTQATPTITTQVSDAALGDSVTDTETGEPRRSGQP